MSLVTVIITTNQSAINNDKQMKAAGLALAKIQKLLRPLIKEELVTLKVTEEVSEFENA